MGFRFQKRIKIMPGVTINLSKSGVSTSIGTTGARVTYGHGQKRTTVGLPGSGLSHTTVTKSNRTLAKTGSIKGAPSSDSPFATYLSIFILVVLAVVLASVIF